MRSFSESLNANENKKTLLINEIIQLSNDENLKIAFLKCDNNLFLDLNELVLIENFNEKVKNLCNILDVSEEKLIAKIKGYNEFS